jgi:hypothetical protein
MRIWKTLGVLALILSAIASGGCGSGARGDLGAQTETLQGLRDRSIDLDRRPELPWQDPSEAGFRRRSRAIREKLARADLSELDRWWRREQIGDPHKYLLPAIVARLSLSDLYGRGESLQENRPSPWEALLTLERDRPDLYHFRSIFDIRLFFLHRETMPPAVLESYRSMTVKPRVEEWLEGGTENHLFMQYASGLAFLKGSQWPPDLPHIQAVQEGWLRLQLKKFLTIGQGEFHSSTYYGYSIAGVLNLYDFAPTPELRSLATALLDWYAANMAVRFSWGTAGGAESRKFDRGTWDSGLSWIAWLWWGDEDDPHANVEEAIDNHLRVALLPALSDYRPPPHLRAIARKEIPLPFELRASHPAYFSSSEDNHLWEDFYATEDYTLGTLLEPSRSYQVEGTIRAQYATYKLVIRDRNGGDNAVVSLAGTYHTPMATGRSPADQYLQDRGTVLYQQVLNAADRAAGVPARSHLVLPRRYGEPRSWQGWRIWKIENIWLLAHPWGDRLWWNPSISETDPEYAAFVAEGERTAWITEVAPVKDYPTWEALTRALAKTEIDDRAWNDEHTLIYTNLAGRPLQMTYNRYGAIAAAQIDGRDRVLENWPVLESPYLRVPLDGGLLEIDHPTLGRWQLSAIDARPEWKAIAE